MQARRCHPGERISPRPLWYCCLPLHCLRRHAQLLNIPANSHQMMCSARFSWAKQDSMAKTAQAVRMKLEQCLHSCFPENDLEQLIAWQVLSWQHFHCAGGASVTRASACRVRAQSPGCPQAANCAGSGFSSVPVLARPRQRWLSLLLHSSLSCSVITSPLQHGT